jgi:hypothetical protein
MALWAAGTTYADGAAVTGSNGTAYTSLASGNIGHDPTATTGFWTQYFNWTLQKTWSQGAWSPGAWSPGAFGPGVWH